MGAQVRAASVLEPPQHARTEEAEGQRDRRGAFADVSRAVAEPPWCRVSAWPRPHTEGNHHLLRGVPLRQRRQGSDEVRLQRVLVRVLPEVRTFVAQEAAKELTASGEAWPAPSFPTGFSTAQH